VPKPLEHREIYPCPVCRHGEISALFLTEAFACNFCRHIFTCEPETGLLRVEDNAQRLTWRWDGRTWHSINQEDRDLTFVIFGVSLALILLPPMMVLSSCWSLLNQGHPGIIALGWTIVTFLIHLSLIAWMLAEHYQIPPYVFSKIYLREWLDRQH